MDIEKLWQNSSEKDHLLERILQRDDWQRLPSKTPLNKLRKNLVIGLVWAVLITALYVLLLFVLDIWQARVALGVMLIFNITVMIDTWRLYRNIPSVITPSNSLKEELTVHYTSFQKWWSLQQRMGLFVYPIAAAGGFMVGGVEGSGKSVEEFLYNPKMLLILGITLLILVPLCYLLARWMFNYAYGKHLKQLKATIDALE